jgi:two-component system, OmpR family, phosphate regulon sensor histidine kinase PhoR
MYIISAIGGAIVGGVITWIAREKYWQRQIAPLLASLPSSVDRPNIGDLPIDVRLRRQCQDTLQAFNELQTTADDWERILREIPVGFLYLDADDRLLWCNQAARQLLHIEKWSVDRQQLFLEIVRSFELDTLIQDIRQRQKWGKISWDFHPDRAGFPQAKWAEVDRPKQDLSIALQASGIPLKNGSVGVFILDKQQESELIKARERWMADLAHELRTPLTSIRLVLETLQEQVSPRMESLVDRTLNEVDRLVELIQDFLTLSYLEQAPSEHLQIETIDLPSIIRQSWQTIAPFAEQKNISMQWYGVATHAIEADADRLQQLFVNLFDNAVKYTPPGGIVKVKVDIGNDLATIDIIDSGDGFNGADIPFLFDRLFRGDRSRQRQQASSNILPHPVTTSSGLGLAIVRQIARAHGGEIVAQNHPETGSAWLQLTLPMRSSSLLL